MDSYIIAPKPVIDAFNNVYLLFEEYRPNAETNRVIVYKIYAIFYNHITNLYPHTDWAKKLYPFHTLVCEFMYSINYKGSVNSTHLIDTILASKMVPLSEQLCKTLGTKLTVLGPDTNELRNILINSPHTYAPAATKHIYDKIMSQSTQSNTKKTSDMYKCKICGARKTTYVLKQARASDEAQTIIITCQVCNNIWHN